MSGAKKVVIYFLPPNGDGINRSCLPQQAVKHTVVEDRMPYLNSFFDVCCTYLTTLAISDRFYPKEILSKK